MAALAARIGAALGREDDQRPADTSFAQDDDESEFADDNGDNDDSGPDDPPPRSAETVALIQPGLPITEPTFNQWVSNQPPLLLLLARPFPARIQCKA